jgi:hypothetical protein
MADLARSYRKLLHVVLAIVAGLIALTALKGQVLAGETHTFVVPIDDGYGLNDCIGKNQACAEVVASTWCEAQGLAAPLVYGRAEDIAASATLQPAHFDPDSFVVTCK